ncbi:hypothetical protein [Cellulomonas bogoriensis]|uniref:Uncharacterized protein n=1 Tax=Cellulomonas bogoriensis 69B4 = DSM 16987 TaxID=1386082 RepID=A0A0A0C3A3_9CELL|nr:hypothetical protein [Cellulomonas bogoriensis]KGM13829.1 hypothetical protein N869_09330 [Cellulomonas bogoriensis 69B4 = DSM 16987]
MTTMTVDTRTFRFRLPVLLLGRLRGTLVVELTEKSVLRIERREARARPGRLAHQQAVDAVEGHRTAAVAQRMGAGF